MSLILPAINDTSKKRKCPKSSFIYDHIIQTQALNADKVLIKSIIVKLTLEDKIVTPLSPQDKDSFYNFAKVTDSTRYDPSQNQIHCINSSDISSSIYIAKPLYQLKTIYLHLYAKILWQTVADKYSFDKLK